MKKVSRALTGKTLKIYWQHAMRYRWQALTIVLCIFFANLIDVYVPYLFKGFFDLLAQGSKDNIPELSRMLWWILSVNLVMWVLYRVAGLTNNYFQPRVMSDLLNTCYGYLQKHSISFFDNSFVGSLVRRITRYSSSFETIADQLTWEMGRIGVRIGAILIVLLFYKPLIGVVAVVWAVAYIAIMYKFAKYKLKYDIEAAEMDTEVTKQAADTITNQYNLKVFSAITREVNSFSAITEKLAKIKNLKWNLEEIVNAVQALLIFGLEIGVLFLGLHFWEKDQFTIGDFVLVQTYMMMVFDNLWGIGRQIRRTYEALADADEMTEILAKPHSVQDVEGAKRLIAKNGRIEFLDVTFGYKGNIVFEKFNLTIKPGEKVAIVGPSGGGKTTLTKLLFRFYDLEAGKILIDGEDVSLVTQDSLRENLSLVPQEPILFHRSLLENIRYAQPKATEKEVVAASKLAFAHDFIEKLPEKYKTLVGERGVKLSGGERQRVAIARAILKNSRILVMDEATSALDSESEYLIQEGMKNLMRGKTVIVIAHRLSTIMQMDRIIVVENGKIVEQGSHIELLKAKKGTYQKLWGIQAGGFTK